MIRNWFSALSGDKSEEPLEQAAFRDLYLAYLKKAAPDVEFTAEGDLELKVSMPGGGDHSVFLDNAYQQYLADPKSRDETLELYIASFLEIIAQEKAEIDPSRIVPVIKDRGWMEDIRSTMEERGGDPEEMPSYVSEIYNSELAIFYAEDSPRNIRYLTDNAFADLKLDRSLLRGMAVENLRRLVKDFEVQGGDGLFRVTAGGDYEASLLLLDSIWSPETLPVKGNYVVAIPSRDLLMVTGTEDGDAIERLRELASEGASQFSYSLSPVLFVRQNDAFEVFEG